MTNNKYVKFAMKLKIEVKTFYKPTVCFHDSARRSLEPSNEIFFIKLNSVTYISH